MQVNKRSPKRWPRAIFPVLGLFLATATVTKAQLPVTVSVFNESTSVPFTDWWSLPIHPGVEVGVFLPDRGGGRFGVVPGVSVGYLFHRELFQGMYARVNLGFSYHHPSGLNLKARLGGGYLRTYAVRTEYRMVDGQLRARPDRGNHRFMPSLSWGVGYRLRRHDPRSTEIFLLHETWLEYPYAGDFIPVMPHTNLHLGATFYPFTQKQSSR